MQRARSTRWRAAFTGLFAAALAVVLAAAAVPLALALDPKTPLARYGYDVWQDDLPQNTVHTILQTRDGYLWLGTYEGLVRFNGVAFDVFDKETTPEIRNNGIRALYEGRDGTLWVGTSNGGLVAHANGAFRSWTTEQGLADDAVYAICGGADGAVWIGTGGGLSRFDGERFTSFTAADGLPDARVRAVWEDRAGTLWAGTDKGLCRFREGRFETAAHAEGAPDHPVVAIREDRSGRIWVGTDGGGVRAYDGQAVAAFTTADGLSSNRVYALYEDRAGALWIGTDGGGLNRYADGAFSQRTLEAGLSDSFVRAICEDAEGSLWIGTNGGLNRLKDGKFIAFTMRDGLSHSFARVVCQDASGAVWVGTDGGGLNRIEGERITAFAKKDGLPNDFVRALWPDRKRGVWIGTTGGGLALLDDGRFTTYTTREGLAGDDVRAIFQDSRGAVWVGTGGSGVSRLENGRFTTYTSKEGLAGDDVRAIFETRDGAVWFGTSGNGASRFKDGRFERFTAGEGLAGDVVFSFFEDEVGLWIGTSDGLTLYRDGRFARFTTRHGLFDDIAFQILDGGDGNLWMSCNKGVYRVSRSELAALAAGGIESVHSTAYGKADGMGSTQCNGASQPAGWRSGDGRLWFPTASGVAVADPAHIPFNDVPPPVTLSRVMVDGKAIGRGVTELDAGSRRFEFHYDGLSFVVPEKVRFEYMLEGLDREWIDAGTRRVAYYTSLPAGTYTFRVRAANNDGVWSEQATSFGFTLPPPLWRTWWAIAIYAVAIAAVVLAAHRVRTRALERRNALLEAEVAARTVDLESSERRALDASRAKSTFLANMSHELRTPLNAIIGFAQLMKRDRSLPPEQRDNLSVVERSGEHLLALINDVLSLSKIEAGRVELNARAYDLHRMLALVRDTFRLRAEAKSLRFEVEIDPALPEYVFGDEGKLRQILINLLGNAFKFTEEGGVALRAAWRDGRAIFEVEDTGPGIPEHEIGHLFDAFVQTSSGRKTQEGTGLGLAISRTYAELMGGKISVRSDEGRGTAFQVEVELEEAPAAAARPIYRHVLGLESGQPVWRVLVADDVLENRMLLSKLLRAVGFEVREAANGREAVDVWAEWAPDLIWMDLRLPVMSGVEAAREIRARERTRHSALSQHSSLGAEHCRILALTASIFTTERDDVLEAGCDDFVTKPFKESTIFEKMAEHLGVQYVYEKTGQTGPLVATAAERISPERFEAIPPDLVDGLARAAQVGDVEEVFAAINLIGGHDERLGDALRTLARRYRFDEILASVGAS